MKKTRTNTFIIISLGFLVLSVALTGCGEKKDVSPAKEASTAAKSESTEPAAEEIARPSNTPITEERTYYDFESDLSGWEVPLWAQDKDDYKATGLIVSKDAASSGDASMKMMTDFKGGSWAAGLAEIQQYLDLSNYRVIKADLYIPKDAPIGLKAKIILTVGSNWKFVEMSRSIPLVPGEWVTVTANIEPGSYDWKRVVPDEEFAEDVRKVAIRIESNRKPAYTGPIYIDNIRVGR